MPGENAEFAERAANLAWLLKEFSDRLASVFETMAGERPSPAFTSCRRPRSGSAAGAGGLLWRQPFTCVPGPLWIYSPEPDWTFAAELILRAAGMEDSDRETRESTYLETIGQALGGVAQAISLRLGREVTPSGGEKAESAPGEIGWIALELNFGGGTATIYAGPDAQRLSTPSRGRGRSRAKLYERKGTRGMGTRGMGTPLRRLSIFCSTSKCPSACRSDERVCP